MKKPQTRNLLGVVWFEKWKTDDTNLFCYTFKISLLSVCSYLQINLKTESCGKPALLPAHPFVQVRVALTAEGVNVFSTDENLNVERLTRDGLGCLGKEARRRSHLPIHSGQEDYGG